MHLVVAEPVPRALLGGLRDDVEVLLDRGAVGHRHVELHDHRHADAHGLAVQRREGRVGLLVEGQRRGAEVGRAGPRGAVRIGHRAHHGVRRAGLEQPAGGPRRLVGCHRAGDRARVGSSTATEASVPWSALHRDAMVDGDVRGAARDVGLDHGGGLHRRLAGIEADDWLGPAPRPPPPPASPEPPKPQPAAVMDRPSRTATSIDRRARRTDIGLPGGKSSDTANVTRDPPGSRNRGRAEGPRPPRTPTRTDWLP